MLAVTLFTPGIHNNNNKGYNLLGAGVANAPPPIIFFCYLEVRAQKEGAHFGFFSLLLVDARFFELAPTPIFS